MKKTLLFLITIVIIAWIFENHSAIRKNSLTSNAPLTPALGQNKNMPDHLVVSTNVATDLLRGTFDANSKSNRVAIAKDILNQINLLDSFIASPTPNEMNWINSEYEATKNSLMSSRRINLVDSPEFQVYKLKNYLSAIKNSLGMIIYNDNIHDEMYWWGNLSSQLIDPSTLNDALYTLKINNKYPSDIERSRQDLCIGDGETVSPYNMCYHSDGEGILAYILMPYLQGQKMDNP